MVYIKNRRCWKKIPDVSLLVTNTASNTKIKETEDKVPDASRLVASTAFNTKTKEIENEISNQDIYITAH